jgi:phosphate transport system substrate-binding protein
LDEDATPPDEGPAVRALADEVSVVQRGGDVAPVPSAGADEVPVVRREGDLAPIRAAMAKQITAFRQTADRAPASRRVDMVEARALRANIVESPSIEPTEKPFWARRVAVVALILLLAGAGGFITWGKLHGAQAGSLDPRHTILRLSGSNTIGDSMAPALAEAFLKAQGATNVQIFPGGNPQEKIVQGVLPGDSAASAIKISAHGSATAFTALADGSCDIGMASRRIKPDEVAKLAQLGDMTSAGDEHILGLDGIAVVVNASNPLSELRKDQIKRIFTGEVTDWSQVSSTHGPINIYARDDKSGTFDTFKSLVLTGAPLTAVARRFEDSNALSEAVSSDPNSIGFIGLPFVHNAKAIAVSEKGISALRPTRLTVATEDYSLSRRLYLYTPAVAPTKFTQKFVEFALSKQGQDVVAANGFIAQNVEREEQAVSAEAPDEYKELTQKAERLSLDFRFEPGKAAQDNKAEADLDRIVSLIADRGVAGGKILLFGFADNTGAPEINEALSLDRAKVIEDQLVQRGIKPVAVKGFGAALPVASNDTDDGREKNRRVEIWIKD